MLDMMQDIATMGEHEYTVTAETRDYRTWHTTATKDGKPCGVGRRKDGTEMNRRTSTQASTARATAEKARRDMDDTLAYLTAEHVLSE